MADELEIPDFLKRNQQEPTMTNAPAPKPERKPRTRMALPNGLTMGDEVIMFSDLTLHQLVDYREIWRTKLAEVPRLQLELRAINEAIRKELTRKAK